jgi:hypothetical protein
MEHDDSKRALELEQEIEREEHKLQELTHELKEELEHEKEHHTIKIVVHDEDSGLNYDIEGPAHETVNFFIEKLYNDIGRSRKPDDRLRCDCTGADVFQYAHMNIEHYSREFCKDRYWTFVGGTGGADGIVTNG